MMIDSGEPQAHGYTDQTGDAWWRRLASELFNVPEEQVTDSQKRYAKSWSFNRHGPAELDPTHPLHRR